MNSAYQLLGLLSWYLFNAQRAWKQKYSLECGETEPSYIVSGVDWHSHYRKQYGESSKH